MKPPALNVLLVGSTGSIGLLAVEEAIKQGHSVKALVRSTQKASKLPVEAIAIIGDLTKL